ncbi:MAG: PepSY domain-containing protein [Rhodobacteraceae bacterium]|nr:PepSY domain-containing protein [Paracoccaceae bacterium]
MKQQTRAKTLKVLRASHAWLAIFVLPWVLMIGRTGFYLNHAKAILKLIEPTSYDELLFADWPNSVEVTRVSALDLAETIWLGEEVSKFASKAYHKRPSYIMDLPSGRVIVSRATGHYFVKYGFTRETYTPDGTLLHSKMYWGSIFKTLHTRGWLSSRFGTWIADITSFSLVFFSLTGMFLWWIPRVKKVGRLVRRS